MFVDQHQVCRNMSLLQYLTHQQAFNRIDKNKTPILLRKIVSNQVHTVEPYWLWQAVLNRILGKRRDLRRLLSRLLWFFMFFSLPQSVPAQSLNVFEHFKQDSIPTERQLYGLLAALRDSSATIRTQALNRLDESPWGGLLPDAILATIASHIDSNHQFQAIAALNAFGDQSSLSDAYLEQVIPLLKDQNSNVRRYAVEALGSQAALSDGYLQQIVPLLKDQDSDVRRYAAYAMGSQASLSKAYFQQIAPLLKDQDSYVRRHTAEALGNQTSLSDAVLQQIVPLLKDQDSDVRSYAVQALGSQASLSKAYFQQILSLLTDQNRFVRSFAAKALGRQASLSKAYLQQILRLLKDQNSTVRSFAVEALRSQASLSKAYLQQIVPLLKDQDSKVRRDAAYALGSQSVPSDAILQQIIPLLKDKNSNVRRSAAQTLGSQSVLSGAILQQISPLLKDHDSYVRRTAWQNMYEASIAIWYQAFPIVANQALLKDDDKFREDSYESRVPLYEISGGNDTIIFLLKWLCRPSKYPAEIPLKEAQKTLNLIIGLESAMDTLPIFKEEVGKALPELIKAAEKQWRAKDIVSLQKGWGIIQEANPTKADYVRGVIRSIQSKNWFYRLTLAISIHAIFWLLLLFVYPYSPMIQAIFFWNPKMRKWLGLGYVSFLITWIPFLRQRLFAPFKEVLLAEAFPSNWQKAEYFPNSEVYSTRDKKKLAVAKALHPLKGQILLQGESGLGKTMFLRNVAASSKRIIAYLPASKCTTGLIPAIQQKVHGAAADPNFLQQLIYAGAIDILIDGLNEISARACAQLTLEIERYFKGNLLLTSQPMEWEPPSSAKRYELRPLSEPQIEAFLLSRYPYLEQGDLIPESAYQKHGKAYLQAAFRSELDKETLKANRHILSNPMDLALVAQLIARGETPSLLDLQQQQYELMAASYKVNNLSNEFPLGAFSEAVYKMRINDKPEIPHEAFPKEMLSMERWKMVISRQVQMEGQEKSVKQWYFRHDKIMDYFLTQEFLAHPKLCEKHLDDPRFRGVYFLLAYKLKYDDAMLLRERLIQHAAETKDHSLSDTFIQLIRRREKPQMKNKDELKIQILEAISMGETSIALEVLQGHAAGAQEETVAMVANRANTLKNAIIEGIISLEDAQLQRNQINRAILDLVEVVG